MKQKFYTLDNILNKDYTYNFIFGERSNGKTYSVLLYGLKEWVRNGGQFVIVRREKKLI